MDNQEYSSQAYDIPCWRPLEKAKVEIPKEIELPQKRVRKAKHTFVKGDFRLPVYVNSKLKKQPSPEPELAVPDLSDSSSICTPDFSPQMTPALSPRIPSEELITSSGKTKEEIACQSPLVTAKGKQIAGWGEVSSTDIPESPYFGKSKINLAFTNEHKAKENPEQPEDSKSAGLKDNQQTFSLFGKIFDKNLPKESANIFEKKSEEAPKSIFGTLSEEGKDLKREPEIAPELNLGKNLDTNLGNFDTNLGKNLGANLTKNSDTNLEKNSEASLAKNLDTSLTKNLDTNLGKNSDTSLAKNSDINLGKNLDVKEILDANLTKIPDTSLGKNIEPPKANAGEIPKFELFPNKTEEKSEVQLTKNNESSISPLPAMKDSSNPFLNIAAAQTTELGFKFGSSQNVFENQNSFRPMNEESRSHLGDHSPFMQPRAIQQPIASPFSQPVNPFSQNPLSSPYSEGFMNPMNMIPQSPHVLESSPGNQFNFNAQSPTIPQPLTQNVSQSPPAHVFQSPGYQSPVNPVYSSPVNQSFNPFAQSPSSYQTQMFQQQPDTPSLSLSSPSPTKQFSLGIITPKKRK